MFAVAFTGQDGTGKSTQIDRLCVALREEGAEFAVVHQYRPTSSVGRGIAPMAKRMANRMKPEARAKSPTQDGAAPRQRFSRRLLSWVSLWIGWRRSVTNWRVHRDVEVLILDRYFTDEIIRAAHKFGRVSRFGLWLMRRAVPAPHLVVTFTLDPKTGWERKKTREMTLEEYRTKTGHVRETLRQAESIWPVATIAVDERGPDEVYSEVVENVRRRRASRG